MICYSISISLSKILLFFFFFQNTMINILFLFPMPLGISRCHTLPRGCRKRGGASMQQAPQEQKFRLASIFTNNFLEWCAEGGVSFIPPIDLKEKDLFRPLHLHAHVCRWHTANISIVSPEHHLLNSCRCCFTPVRWCECFTYSIAHFWHTG